MAHSATESIANRAHSSYLWPDSCETEMFWNCRVKYPERNVLDRARIGQNCVMGRLGGITADEDVQLSKGAHIKAGGLDIDSPLPYALIVKSIVTEEVPPHSITVGCPAKIFPKSKE